MGVSRPPKKQTIVSDGETLYSYDPDLNQVVETPLKQALKSRPARTSFLLGIGNINRDFKAAFASPPTPTGLIDSDPRREDWRLTRSKWDSIRRPTIS